MKRSDLVKKLMKDVQRIVEGYGDRSMSDRYAEPVASNLLSDLERQGLIKTELYSVENPFAEAGEKVHLVCDYWNGEKIHLDEDVTFLEDFEFKLNPEHHMVKVASSIGDIYVVKDMLTKIKECNIPEFAYKCADCKCED